MENEVTVANFDQQVLKATKPVLVDFWAPWCGPCKMIAPVVAQLATEYAGKMEVTKLNVDDNQDIAMRYQVMGIPTLGLFKDGKLVNRLIGYPGPNGVKSWVDKELSKFS